MCSHTGSESEGLGLQPGSDTYELHNLGEVTSFSLLQLHHRQKEGNGSVPLTGLFRD